MPSYHEAWAVGQVASTCSAIAGSTTESARPCVTRSGTCRAAGLLGGVANLLYLAATGAGQLAVVAVVTALYPAVTILLARIMLHERWSRLQIIGLIISALAVAAISIG